MIIRPPASPTWLLAPLLLTLAGCGLGDGDAGKDAAAGQVLPGTISDGMVPLDSVRSQGPLAPQPGQGSATDSASDAADAAAEPTDAASTAAPGEGGEGASSGAAAPAAGPAPANTPAARPAPRPAAE